MGPSHNGKSMGKIKAGETNEMERISTEDNLWLGPYLWHYKSIWETSPSHWCNGIGLEYSNKWKPRNIVHGEQPCGKVESASADFTMRNSGSLPPAIYRIVYQS